MSFSDGTADFRSDTVTRPTTAMRRAMAEAEVGDDVYGEDPTVNRLEEEAAALVGKEAAVFTPTGTMGNQLGIMIQTRPGEEVLCDEGAHLRNFEKGAASALSGVGFRTVAAEGGRITPEQIDRVMAEAGTHLPRVRLMVWENTHNLAGGRVIPLEVMEAGSEVARLHTLSLHLDGARIFNAVASTGTPADRFAACADTVQFCFSKGLGAPVGSIICGPSDLMAEARYLRKRLGGGMRQVGVLAAAALVGLRDRHRLTEDHDLARYLAEGMAQRAPGTVDPAEVESNMVLFHGERLPGGLEPFLRELAGQEVKVGEIAPGVLRFVTHRDVEKADADRVLGALETVSA